MMIVTGNSSSMLGKVMCPPLGDFMAMMRVVLGVCVLNWRVAALCALLKATFGKVCRSV